jgi:hypothetical protein
MPIPIRTPDGTPLGHATIHLPPGLTPGDLIAGIRDGGVDEYVHLPRATGAGTTADRIREGLGILAQYGKVDCAAGHDEFFAGVDRALSPADLDAILALGWRSDSDGGPGSFGIFV